MATAEKALATFRPAMPRESREGKRGIDVCSAEEQAFVRGFAANQGEHTTRPLLIPTGHPPVPALRCGSNATHGTV